MPDALTTVEQHELASLEATIRDGAEAIWTALATIREKRLYRDGFDTFEDYCRERWGWSRQHANRLIAAGETVALLEPMGSIAPPSERVIRPLTGLPPEQAKVAWTEATEAAAQVGKKKPDVALTEGASSRRKRGLPKAPGQLAQEYRERKAKEEKAPSKLDQLRSAREAQAEAKPEPKIWTPPKTAREDTSSAGGAHNATNSESPAAPVAPAKSEPAPTHIPSALKVRSAVAGMLADPTDEDKAALTPADREWFQAMNRWVQLWLLACPSKKSSAA